MSKLLINEPPLQVLPTLAKLVGLNEAIVLQQIHYWLIRSPHVKQGARWIYKTYAEWQEELPFWSVPTIRRAINNLEERGLIVTTSRWNQMPIDNTKWYTIDYDAVENLTSDQNDQTTRSKRSDGLIKMITSSDQNDQTQRSFWAPSPSDQNDQTNNQRLQTTTTETTKTETTTRDARDNGRNPFELWEDEQFGSLTPFVGQALGDLVDDYGDEKVCEALRIAVEANVRKLSYVKGILRKMDKEAQGGGDEDWRRFLEGKYADDINY